MPAGINEVDALLNAQIQTANLDEERRKRQLQMQEQQRLMNNATQEQIQGTIDLGNASQTIVAEAGRLASKLDERHAATLSIFGTDTSVAGNEIAKLAATQKDAYAEVEKRTAEMNAQKAKAANFMGDPLGAIWAEITMPSSVEARNAAVRVYNDAEARMKDVVASTTTVGTMTNLTKQTTSAAMQKAELDKIQALTDRERSELLSRMADKNIDAISRLQMMDEKGLDNQMQLNNMKLSVVGIQLQRANMALLQQDRAMRIKEMQERSDERQQTLADQQAQLDYYNAGAKTIGAPTLDNPREVTRLLKNPLAQQFIAIGQEIAVNGGNASGVPIGTSAAQSAALLVRANSRRGVGDSDSAEAMLAKEYIRQSADPVNRKNQDQILMKTQEQVTATAANMKAGIDKDGTTNIYRAPGIKAILDASPATAENVVVKTIIAPMAKGNEALATNPDAIIASVADAVKANPSSLNEAAKGIKMFFQAAAETNNAVRQYQSLGLPVQNNYMAKMSTGSSWGTKTYDLTSEVDIKRLLMIQTGMNYSIQPNIRRGFSQGAQ